MGHEIPPWKAMPTGAPYDQPYFYTRCVEGKMRQEIRWDIVKKSWSYDRERFVRYLPGGCIRESGVAFGTSLSAIMGVADADLQKVMP